MINLPFFHSIIVVFLLKFNGFENATKRNLRQSIKICNKPISHRIYIRLMYHILALIVYNTLEHLPYTQDYCKPDNYR